MALVLPGLWMDLRGGGVAKLHYAVAQAGKFFVGECALRFERGQQQLLDRPRSLADHDKAHGGPNAAEVMRAAVRQRQRIQCAIASQLRNRALDFPDAGIELGGEALSYSRKAFGEYITRHGIPQHAPLKSTRYRGTPDVKIF
jgi:hypothetical protein